MKAKIWITLVSIIFISNLPPINYFLQENYNYQNKDGSFRYTEEPGKGLSYDVGRIRFERFKRLNPNKDQILYRSFKLKPWRFWEWYKMLANYQRFTLPHLY